MLTIRSLLFNDCKKCIILQKVWKPINGVTESQGGCYRQTQGYVKSSKTIHYFVRHAPNNGHGLNSRTEDGSQPQDKDYPLQSSKIKAITEKQNQVRKRRGQNGTTAAANQWIQPEGYDTGIVVYNSYSKTKVPLILPRGKTLSW